MPGLEQAQASRESAGTRPREPRPILPTARPVIRRSVLRPPAVVQILRLVDRTVLASIRDRSRPGSAATPVLVRATQTIPTARALRESVAAPRAGAFRARRAAPPPAATARLEAAARLVAIRLAARTRAARSVVIRALVIRALEIRALEIRALVIRAMVIRAMVIRAMAIREPSPKPGRAPAPVHPRSKRASSRKWPFSRQFPGSGNRAPLVHSQR